MIEDFFFFASALKNESDIFYGYDADTFSDADIFLSYMYI